MLRGQRRDLEALSMCNIRKSRSWWGLGTEGAVKECVEQLVRQGGDGGREHECVKEGGWSKRRRGTCRVESSLV